MSQDADPTPEVSLWSETSEQPSAASIDVPKPASDGQVFGVLEKSEAELLAALETLETKIEALLARCEELQQLTDSLTAQLVKERESKTALLDIQSDAKQCVDQLIERLQSGEGAG